MRPRFFLMYNLAHLPQGNNMRQLITLSHQDAQRAIDAMRAECDTRAKGGVLVVSDAHGELIALLRMDGAPFASIQIAVNRFG